MLCINPDVSYSLSVASGFQANYREEHWMAVKNILKYLRKTNDIFLIYEDSELKVSGYTDASFQTDKDDYKSQSGFIFLLNEGTVSWKSFKQSMIVDSTTEAEYIAASEVVKEAVWMHKFIAELELVLSITDPIIIYCDNNGAIAQAKEPWSH